MEIIDSHTHFFPEFAALSPDSWSRKNGEPYWGSLVGKRPDGKKSLQSFPGEKTFLKDMDDALVDRAVIQGWYWERSETCDLMNSEISKFVKRHPDRLSAFASAQPKCFVSPKDAEKFVKKAMDDGFLGVGELHDGVQKFSKKQIFMLAEACSRENFPLCFHITENTPRHYFGKVETNSEIIMEAARSFPKAKFILAHWIGGEIFKNPSFPLAKNIWSDSAAHPLLYPPKYWQKGVETLKEKSLFGSDYPLRVYPKKSSEANFSEILGEIKSNIHGKELENFLGKNFKKMSKIVL